MKDMKRLLKRIFKPKNIVRAIIAVATILLIATSFLPFFLQ